MENIDKRNYHRILYKADAALSDGNNISRCEIIDLSLKGCLLRLELPWEGELEKVYILTWQLSETIKIEMHITISHAHDDCVGFKCEHIDIDSISELRRLVELNIGDSLLLERDLMALSHAQ
ncbi:MAG: PilZ domain-containing protein [Methylococcaceae bacterium]|jgi:hypothetical protein